MTESTLDPARTLPALRSIEAAFSAGVLHPGVIVALQHAGVDVQDSAAVNIVTRCAAMRTYNPGVVWSALFTHHPGEIYRLIPSTWERVSFDAVLAAQRDALDEPFREATASMAAGELAELAALCRTVTRAAREDTQGRPLFAGLASLELPAPDHLMVWHAARLLREHRGDGHTAALVVEGLGRIDALVVHAAMLPGHAEALRRSRRWSPDEWNASVVHLRRRGWLTEDDTPTLTPEGRARRIGIEERTDALAAVAFEPLGNHGADRFVELGTRFTEALEAAGMGSTLRPAPPGAG